MLAQKVIPIFSPEFTQLCRVFHSLERPYRLDAILRFNRTYQPIYGRLGPEERRRAEELVDALIAGVESRELQAKIFGVV